MSEMGVLYLHQAALVKMASFVARLANHVESLETQAADGDDSGSFGPDRSDLYSAQDALGAAATLIQKTEENLP